MGKEFNIQNQFLNKLRKAREQVYVQIKGDRTFQGYIAAFDNYSILLKESSSMPPILIFKHSVAYIGIISSKPNSDIDNIGMEF
jgi:RNA chaperone Hfq